MMQYRERERQNMPLCMKHLFTRGGTWHNLRPQFLLAISSINMRMPPENWVGGGGGRVKSKMNWPGSSAWANLWNPACSLLAMQLHTTCWVLSQECGQQVAGELMKCQDGGREIACITYPQGALVVFPRISHTGGGCSQFERESCAASVYNLLSLFLYICGNESNQWIASSLSTARPQSPKVTGLKRFNCMPQCQAFY